MQNLQNEIETKRGEQKYALNGYLYVTDKISASGMCQFWRCEMRGCRGRLWTNMEDGSFICERGRHTCSETGDAVRVQIAKINTTIKMRATTTQENPTAIRSQVLSNVPISVLGGAPTKDSVRHAVHRVRRGEHNAPANPQTREEIQIPVQFQRYEISADVYEDFLLADSGFGDRSRVLVFGRQYCATWSHQMREVFIDGTFSVAPPLFEQILVILSRRGGFVFPVLFCLLPNKETATYAKVFQMIKHTWPQFNPSSISVDFEQSLHLAIREKFPNAEIRGCFFHLIQNLRKHLSSSHLIGHYNTNADFALHARMITAIAFVPQQDVVRALLELEEHTLELFPQLEPIFEWFTNVYVGRIRNNGTRAAPLFGNEVWSVFQRTLDGDDRTNNFAEACNRKLKIGFGYCHPHIWRFIDDLRKIQKGTDADYEQYVRGQEGPSKRPRYQEADDRILRKVRTYEAGTILEYLRGLAHNFQMG